MKFSKYTFRTGLSIVAIAILSTSYLFGKENIGQKRNSNKGVRTSASCAPASSSTQLDVNNVRTLIHNGGDFWWDLVGNPRYEIPKLALSEAASAKHSMFAGSLWIGGVDESGQLRVAAQTYRQSGNDFWPGPLTSGGASIDDVTCSQWDKHFKITKAEIDAFRAAYASFLSGGSAVDMDEFPAVKSWPAFGEDADGNRLALAPIVDVDGDPFTYTPEAGDYPDISPTEGGGEPDMAIWWIINDKGDLHTETGGEAIGLEIQMLAFAFSTANAINDMTFYKYNVINKSNITLEETFMGQWVDADVGNYSDDYVGCDTNRGLGFAYNGDADDETANGYGANPPAIGVDFFQGPFGDAGERLKMQRFVYYENDFSLRGNPEVATHYYGYLRGFWKDGSRMVDNGQNGYVVTAPGPETDYMFPGDAGFCGGTPTGWSEQSANNPPFDRRFLQSAGPFTLQPGAVNDIITGVVWARGSSLANLGSVCDLLAADDVAQALFDNNFELLDGPDAPELSISEYDKKLLISWDYPEIKRDLYNNYNESYSQVDPVLAKATDDSLFQFQGYILYQLKDASVSASDLFNTELARIVAQCDIEDGVSTIVNRTEAIIGGVSQPVIVDQVMVQGANEGIFRSVEVTEDQFASGENRNLKNYTTYYYGILAYAYNDTTSDGRQFVQGNRFFVNTSAMPHPIDFENFGTTVGAEYGDGLIVTQVAGVGNGGNYVELSAATENEILAQDSVGSLTYLAGAAPVEVKVIDPKEVKEGDYRLEVVRDEYEGTEDTIAYIDATNYSIDSTFIEWILYESGQVVGQSTYIRRTNRGQFGNNVEDRPALLAGTERPIAGHGISITVRDVNPAGDTLIDGSIGSAIVFDDPLQPWLSGLRDNDGVAIWNWIKAGTDEESDYGVGNSDNAFKRSFIYDPEENFEGMAEGIFAPFCLAKAFSNGDASGNISPGVDLRVGLSARWLNVDSVLNLNQIPDVDVVMTNDVTKWSRCIVIETSSDRRLGSGAFPMNARWEFPINQAGSTTLDTSVPLDDTLDNNVQGWSYFPGYAIDVNTGRRLNIFFGENSWDRQNNGDDMVWNPTNSVGPQGQSAGGRHYVYILNTTYDECQSIYQELANGPAANYYNQFGVGPSGSQLWMDPNNTWVYDTINDMRDVYKLVAWVGTPMLGTNYEFNDPNEIPTTARVQLRVNQPFRSRENTNDYPIFTFSTEDIAAQVNVQEVAEQSLMDDVRVVPNPYYAYSRYEASQLQSLVKITNLPQRCNIKIFTLDGTLIRTYFKDSDEPEQRWDLNNQDGVPVASGVYLIHVDGFELGEKIVKLFVTMPQLDLNAF